MSDFWVAEEHLETFLAITRRAAKELAGHEIEGELLEMGITLTELLGAGDRTAILLILENGPADLRSIAAETGLTQFAALGTLRALEAVDCVRAVGDLWGITCGDDDCTGDDEEAV